MSNNQLNVSDSDLESALLDGYSGIKLLAMQILSHDPTKIRMSNTGCVRAWDKEGSVLLEFKPSSLRAIRAAGLVILYTGRAKNGKVEVRTPPKLIDYDPAHLSHIPQNIRPNHPDRDLVMEILKYAGANDGSSPYEMGIDYSSAEIEEPYSPLPEESEDPAYSAPEEPIVAEPILVESTPPAIIPEEDLVDGAYTLEEAIISSDETQRMLEDGRIEYLKKEIKEVQATYVPELKGDWIEGSKTTLKNAATGI